MSLFWRFLGLLVIGSDTSLGRSKTNKSKFHLWSNYEQLKLDDCLQELIADIFALKHLSKNMKFKVKCIVLFNYLSRVEG